jgi:hypothetical protein
VDPAEVSITTILFCISEGIVTTLVGPLSEDKYKVTIGKGGAAGKPVWSEGQFTGLGGLEGDITIFAWGGNTGGSIKFPGAVVNPASGARFDPKAERRPRSLSRLNLSRGQDGKDDTTTANVDGQLVYGGNGGGAGMGNGGNGGAPEKPGSTGGACAGGGSAGGARVKWDQWPAAGNGGDGYLLIVSLIDFTVAEARLDEILKSIDAAKSRQP